VHSSADLGNLAPQGADAKSKLLSDRAFDATTGSVREFWSGLREAVEHWDVDFQSLMLFQDALPVGAGDHGEMEKKIVADLAAQGSQNHQILQWLIDRGARLVGTESAELLLEEYRLAKETLQSALDGTGGDPDVAAPDDRASQLLARRDDFIADRINSVLDDSTLGVLFLGMMHRLDGKLDADIEVLYPFGQPRSASIH
jgi:hypothetical protein